MKKDAEKHLAIEFLRALYEVTPGELIELRAIPNVKVGGPSPRRLFTTSPTEIIEFAEQFGGRDSKYGVYFGVNKRHWADGTKKSIGKVSCVVADVDTVKNGWDTDATIKSINALKGPLRPTACVMSGGGLHLYWFFKDPYELASPSDRHLGVGWIEELGVKLRDIFAGDAVQNIDRILRLPGTFNTKRKAARAEVVWCYDFDRVCFFDLNDACDAAKNVIGDDGKWVPKGTQKRRDVQRAKYPEPDPVDKFADMYGSGKRDSMKNVDKLWRDHVRYHAPRGYVGIHEASLAMTAQLYIANKDYPTDTVVRMVLERIQAIKDRDAPDEDWDMKAEAEVVRKQYESWKPKWDAYTRDRRKEQAAERKKNGRTSRI